MCHVNEIFPQKRSTFSFYFLLPPYIALILIAYDYLTKGLWQFGGSLYVKLLNSV